MHATFEDYCRERWGFSDRRARQLMSGAEVVSELDSGTVVPVPATERQARELARIEPERRAGVWQAAVQTHGGNVTAAKVREIAQRPATPVVPDAPIRPP